MLLANLIFLGLLGATPVTGTTLALVNGTPIDRALVALEVAQEPAARYHMITPEKRPKYEADALERLIDRELFYAEALRRKLEPAKEAVAKHLADAEKQAGGAKPLETVLQSNGLSRRVYEAWIIRKLAAENVETAVAAASEPDSKQIEQYYAAHTTEFVKPEVARVEMIYFPLMPYASTRETAKALTAAKSALAAMAGGVAPQAVTASAGGKYVDMGSVHRGSAAAGIDEAIWAAAPNSVTGPVKSLYGYHVLAVGAKAAPKPLALAEVHAAIQQTLSKKGAAEGLRRLRERLRAEATIIRKAGAQ